MLKLYRPCDAGFGGQDVKSWDHTWQGSSIEEALRWAEICHLRPVFDRYFPTTGRILEGGCGIGQFVLHYHRRGYQIEGVDFSETTIERVRQAYPELSVRAGDVTALPYPDGWFGAYYSGGVVEHFEDGPFKALAEARRILSPEGKLIITVPFLNPLRRMRSALGLWDRHPTYRNTVALPRRSFAVEPPPKADLQFSEYHFTTREFADILRQAGFTIVEGYPCDVEWGEICQAVYRIARKLTAGSNGHGQAGTDTPAAPPSAGGSNGSAGSSRLKRIWRDLFVSENRTTFGRRCLVNTLSRYSGHMLLFVCQPDPRAGSR